MSALHLFLFGGVRVSYDGSPRQLRLPRSAQLVLSYLLLQRQRACPRDVLADIAWGERSEESAHSCLNTALWRLRRVLEPVGVAKGTYLRSTPAGEVGFNWDSDHWLDLSVFQSQAERVLVKNQHSLLPEDVVALESVLPLYSGELLEGFYDDWALRERERLRIVHLNCLSLLMRQHKLHGDYQKGLVYGSAILRLDPLREEIHRDMMRLYLASGQRAQALLQYETCRAALDEELGIPPMEETRRLHQEVLADNLQPAADSALSPLPATLHEALDRLHRAMGNFCAAEVELQEAIRLVTGFGEQWAPRETGRGSAAVVR